MNLLFFILSYSSFFFKEKSNVSICADASLKYNSSYFDTEHFIDEFKNFSFKEPPQKFAGKGHFSVVRKSYLTDGQAVAVKEIRRFKRSDLIKELSILRILKDVDHVVKVVGLTGNEDNPIVLYSYHSTSKNGYQNLTLSQFRWWLKTLLETVSEIHSHGILHRDLNLGNILTDFDKEELTIIDFGLADFNINGKRNNPHTGCFRLKAPELAIERSFFDCKIDMWSIGITCLDLMINLRSNWVIKNNKMLIKKLVTYFGSTNWNNFVEKYDPSYIVDHEVIGDIFELALPGNYGLITPESLDLVFKFLKLDPIERISAKEALDHPFFYSS